MLQVRLETEDFRVEREDLRLAVDKLRGEGSDMKLEIQSLKKVEKLIKVIISYSGVNIIDRSFNRISYIACQFRSGCRFNSDQSLGVKVVIGKDVVLMK